MILEEKEILQKFGLSRDQLEMVKEGKTRIIKAGNAKPIGTNGLLLKFTMVPENIVENYISNFNKVKGLKHPYVIEHHDIFKLAEKTTPYSVVEVLEYANHGNLSEYLRQPQSFGEIIKLFKKIMEGYQFLHSNGLLHRDIKATNILLQNEGTTIVPKISDMEFWLDPNSFGTKSTPEYLAPEVRSYDDYTLKSEVWAIGIMIYELFTGKYPFGSRENGDSIEMIQENLINKSIPEVSSIPFPFDQITKKALVKESKKRPGSVKYMDSLLSPRSLVFNHFKRKLGFAAKVN